MRTMAHSPQVLMKHVSTNKVMSSVDDDNSTGVDPIDPSSLGFTKVAYAVDETLELLSIGRTALYAAVKRGDLKRVKFGKKTLFYAADLAAFLTSAPPAQRERMRARTITGPARAARLISQALEEVLHLL